MQSFLTNLIFSCLLIFSAPAQAQFSVNDFKQLHALTGTWKMTTEKGLLFEHWFLINDSTMHNKSYRVHQRDTIPQETVVLALKNGRITYSSTVANQNNEQAVIFTLTSSANGKYTFENKAHDFPQLISYQLVGTEKLSASISGKIKNSFRAINFDYQRER